jgi:molybdenum cofactor synthesis domain-containing protein
MPDSETVTACVIIIGNEVLSGRTREANLQFLAKALNDLGIRLREARIIADDEEAIVAAVNSCRVSHDYVLTTGGIGPTHDDITSASIAKAFGLPLSRHPQAEVLLRRQYTPAELNEARLKMADLPEGAELIENPVSRAPGFQIGNVFVLPGVPSIMQVMFEGMRHRLRGGAPLRSRSIVAFTTEGSVATSLGRIQARYSSVDIGSYPFVQGGRIGTCLVLRSIDPGLLEQAAESVRAMIRGLGIEPVDETNS